MVNLWLAGICLSILVEFVASANLTLLIKVENEIHLIAISTKWRRMVSKVSMKGVGTEIAKYLNEF